METEKDFELSVFFISIFFDSDLSPLLMETSTLTSGDHLLSTVPEMVTVPGEHVPLIERVVVNPLESSTLLTLPPDME